MLKLAGETLNGMLAEHLDQPDAHMADVFQTLRTGGYYGIPYSSYDSEAAMAANTLYAMPFLVARPSTWDRIAIEVTTAAAGKSARLGIYKSGDNLYPGSLVENTEGEFSVATTGLKEITIDARLTKGWYWLAIVSDGMPSLRKYGRGWTPLGVDSAGTRYAFAGWSVAHSYGSLPDPFTGSGSMFNEGGADWKIVLRLKSLD